MKSESELLELLHTINENRTSANTPDYACLYGVFFNKSKVVAISRTKSCVIVVTENGAHEIEPLENGVEASSSGEKPEDQRQKRTVKNRPVKK